MRWILLVSLALVSCRWARVDTDRAAYQNDPESDATGTLTFQFENDTFSDKSDNNFTAGFGFSWTTAPVETLDEENWFRGLVQRDLAFLPTVSIPAYQQFFQFSLDMEMYTAEDTSDPDPPPDAHPYSSLIALDSAVYSLGDRSMHGYILRLGLVGPSTGGEGIQNWMHEATGRPLAAGWDTQLSNELLFNLFYLYQRRLLRTAEAEHGLGFDFGINGGGGLGNYYVGANAGLQARFGFRMPRNFEHSSPIIFEEDVPGRRIPGGPFSAYVFAQSTGILVGRYLPIDGNTFTDSRSGERDGFYAQLVIGAMISYGRFTLTWRRNFFDSNFQHQDRDDNYSAVTLSYTFR